jgi:uncharacterized RDD family membrane protein YckC
MTQPGQSDPQYGQGEWAAPQGQPGNQPDWSGQPNVGPPLTPYGGALAASGYGQQLSFAVPPGTELASVGRRIGGYFMELLLAIVTLVIGYFIWTLVVWARGQTPGKQVLGMYCYRPSTGRTASWGYMLLRWFGQVLESLIPFGFIITSIMMIVSNEHKAIHDHIAGTVVLHRTS